MPTESKRSPEELGVMSPFQDLPEKEEKSIGIRSLHPKWVILISVYSVVTVLALILIVVVFWNRTVNDPYRTLEVFPPDKYFDNPRALQGNRFQAVLRVEGNLGWAADVGKLMVFSVEGDGRFIPVVIRGDELNYSFSKGQTYMGQVTVEEGGLLYATDLRKK